MKTSDSSPDPLALAGEHDRARLAVVGLKSTDRAAREEILHRAYEVWESEGRPADRKLDNWLQAEAEIMGTR